MTRQRRWQIAKKAAGLCVYCGLPVAPETTNYCPLHLEFVRARHVLRRSREKRHKFPVKLWERALNCFANPEKLNKQQ